MMMLRIPQINNVLSLLSGVVVLLLIVTLDDVLAQRRRYTNSRTRQSTRTSTRPAGPNLCRVQRVSGTNQKLFTNCVANHLQVICERPTFVKWECCPGFFKKGRERGCTGEQPLVNLFNTSLKLDLNNFHTVTSRTNMKEELSNNGAYTVFAPSNEAMTAATGSLNQQLRDGSLIGYHVVRGRLNMTSFRGRNVELVTLDNGNTLRLNKYPYGVSTVNCARVIRPDAMATNGFMHVIDKVMHPGEVNQSLAERIASDHRLTVFHRALNISGLFRKLKKRKASFTAMIPTDRAFGQIPKRTKERILKDPETARRVVVRHIVRGTYCADAIVVSIGLKTLEKTRLMFRCKRDGMRLNDARLVDKDIVSKNGVLHVIDTVLLPDSVKSVGELLDEMHLRRFHKLVRDAGLKSTLECDGSNITLFSPTDYAVGQLSPDYLTSLKRNKAKLREVLNYHIVPGKIYYNSLVGDTVLKTKAKTDNKIKVNVYRNGIRLDKAALTTRPRECLNAVVHRVDKVLIPPEDDFMDLLKQDRSYSTFADLLNKSLKTWSLEPFGSYTLLAPNNWALNTLDKRAMASISANPTRLRRFVQRHFIKRMVLRTTIPKVGSYGIRSMQGDVTEFAYNAHRSLMVNKHARTISEDMMASNGIMYKIDHVLPCSCESRLRTSRGRYINSYHYRRLY